MTVTKDPKRWQRGIDPPARIFDADGNEHKDVLSIHLEFGKVRKAGGDDPDGKKLPDQVYHCKVPVRVVFEDGREVTGPAPAIPQEATLETREAELDQREAELRRREAELVPRGSFTGPAEPAETSAADGFPRVANNQLDAAEDGVQFDTAEDGNQLDTARDGPPPVAPDDGSPPMEPFVKPMGPAEVMEALEAKPDTPRRRTRKPKPVKPE